MLLLALFFLSKLFALLFGDLWGLCCKNIELSIEVHLVTWLKLYLRFDSVDTATDREKARRAVVE
jgi:hypothetical protein